jgi:hypothetical protein
MPEGTCSIDGCNETARKRGWCTRHYERWRRNGDPTAYLRVRNTCTIEGCNDFVTGRGWCRMHYSRWRRTGDPLTVVRPRGLPLAERVWLKVDKTDTCWLWTGSLDTNGYAQIGIGSPRPRHVLVHRLVYEMLVGPIPDGMELDHVRSRGCVHRNCVNPGHLEPVTHAENVRRALGVENSAIDTHCPWGHAYEGNTYVYPSGLRACRICRAEATRRSRARRSALAAS